VSAVKPTTLIQFNKSQTRMAIVYLIRTIAILANSDSFDYLVDDLSIVLAIMHKCHESAPDIPNMPIEAAGKSTLNFPKNA